MLKFTIENIDNKHITAVKNISDKCFGNDFLTVFKIKETLQQQGIFKVIITDNTVAGFCFVLKFSQKDKYFPEFITFNSNNKVTVIQTLAVLPEYQRKGLGTALLTDILTTIETRFKAIPIYYPFWVETTSAGFYKKLLNLGFKKVKEYPHYWHNDSLKHNYRCSVCKSIPCRCSMHLFVKD